MNDLAHISARHKNIDDRLTEWSRYVRLNPPRWGVQPMFVGYQSKARHWDIDPHINIPINMIAAHEIERLVSILPHKHRDALRWIYVWPWVPANKIRRELRVTFDELAGLICEGRDMVMAKLG